MFMRTVQQNVFLILNGVPVTSVTDPELIRPSIPVMTHSLDKKVVARKAKARKCSAEVAGNVQAKVERQHRLLISFSVIPPSRSIPQRKYKIRKSQKITSPWCQATKTFEPHGLLGGGHGDRQAFFTGST